MSTWHKEEVKDLAWREEWVVDETGGVIAVPVDCSADDIIREHNTHGMLLELVKDYIRLLSLLRDDLNENGPQYKENPYELNRQKADAVLAQAEGREFGTIFKEGDAHLIAAAPDLLEACEKALEVFNHHQPVLTATRIIADEFGAYDKVIAAIAKAKGKG